MCRLGRTAGSGAEMSDVHCGVSDVVDGSRRGDARRDAPAPNAGDFVPGLGAFAGHPVGAGTHAFGELSGSKPVGLRSVWDAPSPLSDAVYFPSMDGVVASW
jgi:hypothetical protein